MKRFLGFCDIYSLPNPFPVSESILCYFVSFLGSEVGGQLAPSTIKTYLAAIRHTQVLLGFPEPRESSSLPRLKLVQAGVARVRMKKGVTPKPRLPISVPILEVLCQNWDRSLADTEKAMLTAAALTCFYGFFRAGEITVPSDEEFDPAIHITARDVSLDSTTKPTVVRIHLKKSKCDQFGKGVDVFIGRTHTARCPVQAMVDYLRRRGPRHGHLFIWSNGTPLSKARFSKCVQGALAAAGVPDYERYKGHSFRIGAATAASRAGIADSTIKALGRWNSSAFIGYLRTDRKALSSVAQQLAAIEQ